MPAMIAIRAAKAATVAAIALFASLVTFGNVTDYNTNFAFVEHVLSNTNSIFPLSTIKYRAITSSALHHAAYHFIIAVEALIALLCWIGAAALARRLRADAAAFDRAKTLALGLTLGFLLWQVGLMSIGGEWFGMWQSQQWNAVPSAFRFVVVIIAVLIFVAMPDQS